MRSAVGLKEGLERGGARLEASFFIAAALMTRMGTEVADVLPRRWRMTLIPWPPGEVQAEQDHVGWLGEVDSMPFVLHGLDRVAATATSVSSIIRIVSEFDDDAHLGLEDLLEKDGTSWSAEERHSCANAPAAVGGRVAELEPGTLPRCQLGCHERRDAARPAKRGRVDLERAQGAPCGSREGRPGVVDEDPSAQTLVGRAHRDRHAGASRRRVDRVRQERPDDRRARVRSDPGQEGRSRRLGDGADAHGDFSPGRPGHEGPDLGARDLDEIDGARDSITR